MNIECDMLDISARDYTVWIKNIPSHFEAENNNYEDDIKNFILN